jgi:hypothetical protein
MTVRRCARTFRFVVVVVVDRLAPRASARIAPFTVPVFRTVAPPMLAAVAAT